MGLVRAYNVFRPETDGIGEEFEVLNDIFKASVFPASSSVSAYRTSESVRLTLPAMQPFVIARHSLLPGSISGV